jgi:hypothetical protein
LIRIVNRWKWPTWLLCAWALSTTPFLAAADGSSPPQPTGPGSLSGIWTNSDYKRADVFDVRSNVLRTADAKLPPLQPWAAKLLEERIKAGEAGHPFATTKSRCLPSGVPAMMFGPALPIQILETPGQVILLNEELAYFRIIRLNVKHVPDPDPSYMGDSVGHWEGGTLVVDTIGLTDRTTLDGIGMPHSDALHVVERFRRVAPALIEIRFTIDDPKTFTRAWTTTTHFKPTPPGRRIEEYICENNRNQPDASGVTSGVQSSPSGH